MFSSSNLARDSLRLKSFPSCSESTSIVTDVCVDSCRFARSHCVRRRRSARWFLVGSHLNLRRNSEMQWLSIRLSKSSPPRCGSPAVARTSKTVSWIARIETSNVPPPMSKISMFFSVFGLALPDSFLSRPYAMAAAVGSFTILCTLRPAISAASFVACRCASLKYAGTVTTASLTRSPRNCSAVTFILVKTMEDISSGWNCFTTPWKTISMTGLSSLPPSDTTLNGHSLTSAWTIGSWNFRPISLLASKTVFVGLLATWFFAASPKSRSFSAHATYEGVVRFPWSFAMIWTSPSR
mmetsp:Transcript_56859/g.160462  ORF Transcript_56859/g.160462 Transcript_56859/m.160462 type:complete len:296 (-) Transcript_56859:162-1049(-)